ncbi:putative casein kinase II subunit beta-4 [Phytophthora ramorum]|uniref:putative casein kinase II subunit beta-4 n=1 Tax=Phytophthora ramorum TaxID=164328 RepID=UPI00309953D8|nr:putative casein kinase II subunit beta-4 [Phytophthora ramorum]
MSQPAQTAEMAEMAKMEQLFGDMEEMCVSEAARASVSVSEDDDDEEEEDSVGLDDDDDDDDDNDDDGKRRRRQATTTTSDVEGSGGEDTSWIEGFCSLSKNSYLTVPFYDYALDIVLDIETPNDSRLTQIQQEMIEPTAEMLLQFEVRDVNAAKFNFCMGKTATMLALIFAEARDYAADTNRLMHRHICWRSGRSRWASSSRAESSP